MENGLEKALARLRKLLFQYKNQYKFPKKERYIIGVKQGMRTNSLVGIEDIRRKIRKFNTTIIIIWKTQ